MIVSRVLIATGVMVSAVFLSGGWYDKMTDLFGHSKKNGSSSSTVNTENATLILVDPKGQDKELSAYPKDKIGPLKTVRHAVQIAREVLQRSGQNKPVIIQLSSGVHRIKTSLILDNDLSGSYDRPFIIRGAKDGSSVIRGSYVLKQRISTRKLPTALRRRLSATQHKNVIAYKIPKKFLVIPSIETLRVHDEDSRPLPFALHDQQGSLHPAQYPNEGEGWLKIKKVKKDNKSFISGSSHTRRWAGEPDLWAGGYWKWNWSYETLPVSKINTRAKMLTLQKPPHYNMKSRGRYFIFHALNELDKPGEWYLDKKRGYLIVWPRKPKEATANLGEQGTNDIELSLSNSLITVSNASHIRLEQLVMEYSRHDAIKIDDSRHIEIDKCIIRWTGGKAVVIRDSEDSGIRNSTITDTASGGIVLKGGKRKTLTPGRLFASNNRILRYARLGKTYKAAVEVAGVGNLVFGNYIADAPHLAIMINGNDHVIERNEITNVVNDSSDVGAVYIGRDWTQRGIKIINNYFHDMKPDPKSGFETKVVYLDDMSSGIEVRGNVFFRVEQPIFIGGGRDNVIEENMIIDSKPGIYMDGRGLTWYKKSIINGNSEIRQNLRAVPYKSELWRSRYPHLANILEDDAAMPKYNIMRHNLFVAGTRYLFEPEVNKNLQTIGTDYGPNNVSVRSSYHISDYVETAKRAEDFIPLTHKGFESALSKPLPLEKMDRWNVSGWQIDGQSEVQP